MRRLEIYVSADCPGCQRAREVAAALREGHRGVEVEVIDLEQLAEDDLPEAVIAVPAYVLDGIVVSLGNPEIEALRERLAGAVPEGG